MKRRVFKTKILIDSSFEKKIMTGLHHNSVNICGSENNRINWIGLLGIVHGCRVDGAQLWHSFSGFLHLCLLTLPNLT